VESNRSSRSSVSAQVKSICHMLYYLSAG
jgi:hypothetical protein